MPSSQTTTINPSPLERTIDTITEGLQPYLNRLLKGVSPPNGKLKEQGILSEAEFRQMKQELIKKL